MSHIIIVTEQADRQAAAQGIISLEVAMKRKIQRRRRVAKRLANGTREELETILNQRLAFTHFGVSEVSKP